MKLIRIKDEKRHEIISNLSNKMFVILLKLYANLSFIMVFVINPFQYKLGTCLISGDLIRDLNSL